MSLPLLSTDLIAQLIFAPKLVPKRWEQGMLTANLKNEKSYTRSRLYLDQEVEIGYLRGRFFLYSRRSTISNDDWTVGVAYEDLQGNVYRLVRCNGPAGHTNRLSAGPEAKLPVAPHVHYLTRPYLQWRNGDKHDGLAVTTYAFHNIPTAINHLRKVANLHEPGRLPIDVP